MFNVYYARPEELPQNVFKSLVAHKKKSNKLPPKNHILEPIVETPSEIIQEHKTITKAETTIKKHHIFNFCICIKVPNDKATEHQDTTAIDTSSEGLKTNISHEMSLVGNDGDI